MKLKPVVSWRIEDGTERGALRLGFVKPTGEKTGGLRHYFVTVRDGQLDATIAHRERVGVDAVNKYLKRYGWNPAAAERTIAQ